MKGKNNEGEQTIVQFIWKETMLEGGIKYVYLIALRRIIWAHVGPIK
jgi:hypothetical protein